MEKLCDTINYPRFYSHIFQKIYICKNTVQFQIYENYELVTLTILVVLLVLKIKKKKGKTN